MNFSFDDEQREFSATLRRALTARAPVTRWLEPNEPDPAWRLLVDELQASAPDVPDDAGGLGLSTVELAITAEELGRVVAPTAFVAGVALAQSLLLAAGAPAAKLLGESLDGRALVLGADPAGSWTELEFDADRGTLSGSFVAPVGARAADTLVAFATAADGGACVLAVAELDGARIVPIDGIDPTAGSAVVTLDRLPTSVCATDDLDRIEAAARRRAQLVVAAMALGGARACLDTTVGYASQREQFGSPIGAFQAVKHRLADLLVETELAASAVYLAACELSDAAGELSAPAALDVATATYQRAARDCIQLHGGMGFTWEHPAHLHLERAHLLAALLGGTDRDRRYASIRPDEA